MQNPRTVAVLIHGVGRHREQSIIDAAEQGASDALGVTSRRTRFAGCDAIALDDGAHVLVPFNWTRSSKLIPFERELEKADGQRDPSIVRALWMILIPLLLILPAVFLFFYGIGAALRARGPLLGLFVLLLGAACSLLIVLVAVFAPVMIALGVTWGLVALFDGLSGFWLLVAVLAILQYSTAILVGTTSIFGLLPWVMEFAADVLAYVGNRRRRRNAQGELRAIIDKLGREAPDARLVLVGHSLGTVLLTHTLLELDESSAAHGRITMITMGSPLRTMHRMFPRVVAPPEHMRAQLRGAVGRWCNFWREQDPVGKSLGVHAPDFEERPLGAGGHGNYWADERAWSAVIGSFDDEAWRGMSAPSKPAELERLVPFLPVVAAAGVAGVLLLVPVSIRAIAVLLRGVDTTVHGEPVVTLGEEPRDLGPSRGVAGMIHGNDMLVAGGDTWLRAWDTTSWNEIELPQPEFPVRALTFANESLVVAGAGVHLVTNGLLEALQPPPPATVTALAFDANHSRFACGCDDGTVMVWDRGEQPLTTWTDRLEESVTAIAFDGEGLFLAVRGFGPVTVLDTRTRSRVDWTLPDANIQPETVASAKLREMNRVGERVRSGIERRQQAYRPDAHSQPGLAFSPDGKWLACAGRNGYVVLRDLATAEVTLLGSRDLETYHADIAFNADFLFTIYRQPPLSHLVVFPVPRGRSLSVAGPRFLAAGPGWVATATRTRIGVWSVERVE